jgi:drug/metabolite transporter (DMT)-like permease
LACWATGFALTDEVLLRSVGHVELVFTLLFSRYYLKETLKRSDVAGHVLVVAGVLFIVLGH